MKTDFSGDVLWSKSIGQIYDVNCSYCSSAKMHKTHDKGYVYASGQNLFKTDSAGNLLWDQYLFLLPFEALESSDKGFLILGNGPFIGEDGINSTPPLSPQIGIIKTDSLGNGEDCVSPNKASPASDSVVASSVSFTSLTRGGQACQFTLTKMRFC